MIPHSDLYSLFNKRDSLWPGWDQDLPESLDALPEPTQHLLAKLYRYSTRNLPQWQHLKSPLEVKLEWERTTLCRHPDMETENFETLIEGLDWSAPWAPLELLRRMTQSRARYVQEEAIRAWDACLLARRAKIRDAQEALLTLLNSPHEDIVLQVLHELQRPHYFVTPPPLSRLKHLLDCSPQIALEALKLTEHHAPKSLWLKILGSHEDRVMRLQALKLLGPVADVSDLDAILDWTSEDPVFYGEVALQALLDMRRNNIDLTTQSMQRLLELLNLGFAPACVVELICGRWEQWVEHLTGMEETSSLWPLLIQTLRDARHQAASDFLVELLQSRRVPECLAQIIRALAELGVSEAEHSVLELAFQYPKPCLFYIKRVGSSASAEFLEAQLRSRRSRLQRSSVLEAFLSIENGTAELFRQCFVSDWSIKALKLVNPEQLPLETLKEIARRPYHPSSDLALELLGRRGEDALLRCLLTEENEDRFDRAAQILRALGKRWHFEGRCRPRFLSHVSSGEEAGEAFLAHCLVLEIEGSTSLTTQRRLFEKLAELRHPDRRDFLRKWREHSDPEVRKYILQFQTLNRTSPHPHWLLSRLKSSDIRDVRWALKALAELGETWYGPQVAECLKHPNMNIKKTAAEALRKVGDRRILPQIVHYLSYHDNSGLQDLLKQALGNITGSYRPALLNEDPKPKRVVWKSRESLLSLKEIMAEEGRSRDEKLRRFLQTLSQRKQEERFALIAPIREALATQEASYLLFLRMLKDCDAVPTLPEAKLAWNSEDFKLKSWALSRLLHGADFPAWLRLVKTCEWEDFPGAFWVNTPQSILRGLVEWGLKRGWFNQMLKIACEASSSWVVELRGAWRGLYRFAPDQQILLDAWKSSSGTTREELSNWLESEAHRSLRACDLEEKVHALLDSPSPGARQNAAGLLLKWGGERNRIAVVESLLKNRLPARGLKLQLNSLELKQLILDTATQAWSDQIKFLIQKSDSPAADKLQALLHFKTPDNLKVASYRHAFRDFQTELVLAALQEDIDRKDWSSLCLIPPSGNVPQGIVARLSSADQETAFAILRMLLEWDLPLHGPGLLEALLSLRDEEFEPDLVLQLLAKLSRWTHPEHGEQLVEILAESIASNECGKLAQKLMKRSLLRLSPLRQLAWRWELTRSQNTVIDATQAYLREPEILESLPRSLQQPVLEESLKSVESRDPDTAIPALKAVLAHQARRAEAAIKKALSHPCSRVRFFALRQVKNQLSKSDYFELSSQMLYDPQPSMRKRAIKTLSHGRYQPAVPKIVDLLWDRKRKVDRAAREALVRYGELALPLLKKRAAQVRPDRRRVVCEVISEIENA